MKLKKYIAELKRRNVFKSAIAYLIAAWLIFQVAETVLPLFEFSSNLLKTILYVLGIGFPIWIVFSWIYDITSEGVKKTEEVDENTEKSIFDNRRYHKAIIASLSLAVILLLVNLFWNKTVIDPNSSQIATSVEEERKSIAVLPFENRSELKQDESFTDGIHDDLLTQISKIKGIKNIYVTSVREYRNTTKNMVVIGEELGVANILEGGVQRNGNQIKINVKLIEIRSEEILWSETYTKELSAENIFLIQSEIAQAIATALKTILSPQEKQNIDKLPTKNLAALEAWFQAKKRLSEHTTAGYQEAIIYLKKAINLDSTFAIAYADLGRAYKVQIQYGGLPREGQEAKAKTALEKAMQLDSTNSDIQMWFGDFKWEVEGDLITAELAFQKAIELNPNNAIAYIGYGRFYQDEHKNFPKAIEYYYKGFELDPLDSNLGLHLAGILSDTGQKDKAREIVEDILSREPNYPWANKILSEIALFGDFQIAESIRLLHKGAIPDPYYQIYSILMGWSYVGSGDKKHAIKWLNHALQLAPESGNVEMIRGDIYKLQGEYNKAFDAYIKFPKISTILGVRSMFYLMEVGFLTNRTKEVIEHYRKIYPELFQSNVIIDDSNFTLALALGRLLKAEGNNKQANHLLNGSLKIAQEERSGGWRGRTNNWECRVNLALGNNKEALLAYKKLVDMGWHSDMLLIDPIYAPLYKEPEYQRITKIMKTRLEEERAILREMEANGDLDIPPLPKKVAQQ